MSRNKPWTKKENREKFGIQIPNTIIVEALQFDKEAGNTKWAADLIKKQIDNLERLKFFKYYPTTECLDPKEGWQRQAPLTIIFNIKNKDLPRRSRLVLGGHKVDSTGYNTYSSQVNNISVLLLF